MVVTAVRWEASMKQLRGPCSWWWGRILGSGLGHPSWIPPTRGFLAFGGETNVKRSVYEMMNIFVVHVLTNIYCYILNDLIIAESAGKKKGRKRHLCSDTSLFWSLLCVSSVCSLHVHSTHSCLMCACVHRHCTHLERRVLQAVFNLDVLCAFVWGLLHRPGPWTLLGSRQVEM